MANQARDLRILVVAADYYQHLTDRLENGACDTLAQAGVSPDRIMKLRVPGCWELPLAVQRLIRSHSPDGVLALGVVIKGETDHYEHIARETCKGLMRVSLEEGIPVGLGVLTCHNEEQAERRSGAGPGDSNKGNEAALAVLQVLTGDPG